MADPTAPRREGATPDDPASTRPADDGPRFALSFIEGRALVGFEDRPVSPWLTVRRYAMEIPDVTFPFDVTGGAERFRSRRCRLVALSFEADEAKAVPAILGRCDLAARGLSDVTVAFAEGFVEVGGTVAAGSLDETGGEAGTPGVPVPFTLKIAVDASADREVRLLVHDVRLYGETTLPAPAVATALLAAVADSDLPVEVVAPAVIRFDPVPGFLRGLLPRHGWKLPDARHLRLTGAEIHPGELVLELDAGQGTHALPGGEALRPFLSALEGSRAFEGAERAIAEGRYADARQAYLDLEGPLLEHPFAAERSLALLAAEPTTRDEATDLAKAWLEREPGFPPALWVVAQIRRAAGDPGAAKALVTLSVHARERGEILGALNAAAAAGAAAEDEGDLGVAVSAWERALAVRAMYPPALEALARLYPKVADLAGAARVLGHLLTVTRGADRARAHLALGRLHAGEADALGVPTGEVARAWGARRNVAPFTGDLTRAKLHFDAALRLDPELTGAWLSLGRACLKGAEPLRAVRCLDEGRSRLVAGGKVAEASRVAMEIARLWETELDHPENALLRYREVLDADPEALEARLRYARLAEDLGHLPEAEDALVDALALLDPRIAAEAEAEEGVDPEDARSALDAHLALARLARARHQDPAAAASHLEAACDLCVPAGRPAALPGLVARLVARYEEAGDPRRLADACVRAASIMDDPAEAATCLARAARVLATEVGDVDAARARLADARRLDTEGLAPLEAALAVAEAHGPPAAAAEALAALAERRADAAGRADALLSLGHLRADALAEPRGALEAFAKARAEAPGSEAAAAATAAAVGVARRLPDPEALASALAVLAEDLVATDPDGAGTLRLEEAMLRETRLEDPEGAEAALAAGRAVAPEDPRILWHLGRLVLDGGDPEGAHRIFEDLVIVGGPEAAGIPAAEGARRLGEAAMGAGDRAAAAELLEAAWDADPTDDVLYERVDGLLGELGRPAARAELARRGADAALEEGDASRASARLLAAAHLARDTLGDPDAAVADAQAALDAVLPEDLATVRLALRIEGEGGPVEPEPGDAAADAAATVLLDLGERTSDPVVRAEARQALAALAGDGALAAGHLVRRADDLAEAGETEASEGALETALALDPGREDLRLRLADALAKTDPGAALAHYEVLLAPDRLAADPDRAPARLLRAAELAEAAGDVDRARHHLGLYLARVPADEVALGRYTGLLRAAGDPGPLYDALVQHAEILAHRGSRGGDEAEVDAAVACLTEAADLAETELDRPEAARFALEGILAIAPDEPGALARILPYLGADDGPLKADVLGRLADQARDPAVAAAHLVARGDTLAALGDLHGAGGAYTLALEADPTSVDASEGMAAVAWARRDLAGLAEAGAWRADQAADRGEADAARRHLVVARLRLDALGDTAGGRLALDAALDAAAHLEGDGLTLAETEEAHRRRLACHLGEGDAAGADADLSALLAVHRRGDAAGRASLLRHRAELREDHLEDPEGAREDWAEAHALDPDDPVALGRLLAIATAAEEPVALALLHGADAARRARAGDADGAARALAARAAVLGDHLGDADGAARALEEAVATAGSPALAAELRAALRRRLRIAGNLEGALGVALAEAEVLEDGAAGRHLAAAAREADADGRPDLALHAARAAFARAPSDPVVAAEAAWRLVAAGSVEEAEAATTLSAGADPATFAEASDLDLPEAVGRLLLVATALAEVDPVAATALTARLADADPARAAVADLASDLAARRGDPASAIAGLETHLAHVRHPARRRTVARRLADLAAETGDPAAEARWLAEAAAEAPEDLDRRIEAHAAAGDAAATVALARRRVEGHLESGDAGTAREILGAYAARLAGPLEAPEAAFDLLAAFDDLAGADPALLEAHLAVAEALGRHAAAADDRARLAELAAEDGDEEAAAAHLVALGHLRRTHLDDPRGAEAALTEALHRGLRDKAVADEALALAEARGDPAAAADLHELAVDLTGDPVEAAGHLAALGELYAGPLKSPDAAEAAWRAALERAPGHPAAHAGLERLLAAAGRRADLAELARAAAGAAEGRDRAEAHLAAAGHALAAGDAEAALQDLLAARATDAAAFAEAGGDGRLDAARAAAGRHRERAEARLDAAVASDDPESLYLEAGDLLRDEVGDPILAERAYHAAFKVARSVRSAERLAALLAARGDDRGLAELDEARAPDAPEGPARAALYRAAGDRYLEAVGDLDAAIQAYDAAHGADPADREIAGRLEAALREAGRADELGELLRTLAEDAAGADRARRLAEAAALKAEAGDFEGALACRLEAEAADPEDTGLLRGAGDALWDAGRRDEAAIRYRRLVSRDPGASRAFDRLAEVLEARDDPEALAEVVVARAGAAEGRLALDLWLRAEALLTRAGDAAGARDAAERAFALEAGDPEAFAVALRHAEDDPRAAAEVLAGHLAAVPADDPARPGLLRRLAEARRAASDVAGAREALDALLEIVPEDAGILALAADLASTAGEAAALPYDARLVEAAEAGAEVDPEALAAARRRLGTAAAAAGNPGEAVRQLRAALATVDPGDRPALATALALAARRAGLAEAEAEAETVLAEVAGDDAERRGHLVAAARAREAAGQADGALPCWEAAFDLDPAAEDAVEVLLASARARGDAATEILLLRRHADALDDSARRLPRLLELAEVATTAEDTRAAEAAGIAAFDLAPEDPRAAAAALPGLRARGPDAAADLARALECLARDAEDAPRVALLLEAGEALDAAGDAEHARAVTRLAVDAARDLDPWDEALRRRIRAACDRLLAAAADPVERGEIHGLVARAAEGEGRLGAWLAAAEDFVAGGDRARAAAVLDEAARAAPQDPRPREAAVALALDAGDLDAAAAAARGLAEAVADRLPEEVLAVADAAYRRPDLARGLLAIACARAPTRGDLALRLADACEAAADPAAAAEALTAALASGALDAEAQGAAGARLARLHAAAGDAAAAAETWVRLLDRDPRNAEALEAVEAHHLARKDFDALDALHRRRAQAFAAAGDVEAAAGADLSRAAAAELRGDLEAARAAVDSALARRPGWDEALSRLAGLARAAGDTEAEARALETRLQAAEDPRGRADAATALGRLHHRAGDDLTASAAYRVALVAAGEGEAEGAPAWAREAVREGAAIIAGVTLAAGDPAGALALVDRAHAAGAEGVDLLKVEARAAALTEAFDRARAAFRRILEIAPEDPMALEGLAQASAALGDEGAELEASARRAEVADEADEQVEWHLARAGRARDLGRDEDAAEAEDAAFAADPADDRAFEAVRRRLEGSGDARGLHDLWRRRARAVEDDRARAEAFYEQGEVARLRLGEPLLAAEAYERALAVAPDHAGALAALAESFHLLGRPDRAEPLYRRLPEGGPGLPAFVVHHRLGEIEANRGRLEAALSAFQAATARNAGFLPAWQAAEETARRLGDLDAEARALEGLLDALPEEADEDRLAAVKALGALEKRRLQTEAALGHYEAARALAGTDREVLEALADLYGAQGRWREAADALETLAESVTEPDAEAEVWVRLARLHTNRLADADGALPCLLRAVAADPDHAAAWRLRLELEAPRGDAEAVALCARRLAELGQEAALEPYRLEVGRALLAARDPAGAAPWLLAAARARPADGALAAEAAAALTLSGRPEDAAALLGDRAEQTGTAADRREAAEAALAAGDARGYVEGMWAGLADAGLEPRIQALAARGLADVMAHRLAEPAAAAEALGPFVAAQPEDRALASDRATYLEAAGETGAALALWLDLARGRPDDVHALRRAAAGLEAASPVRARFIQGLVDFVEGTGTLTTAADVTGARVSEIARMEIADPAIAGPLGWFLRAMSPYLEPLFPADLLRAGADETAYRDPARAEEAERLAAFAQVVTDRPLRLYVSDRLGFELALENTRPVSVIVGADVLEAPTGLRDQVLLRAAELAGSGYALPGKFTGKDFDVLVRLALAFFDPAVAVPLGDDRRTQYLEAMGRLCPPERRAQLEPLAAEAVAALPRFDPAGYGAALRRTADRLALLLTAEVPATLEALLRLDRRSGGDPETRGGAVHVHPAAFDLCRFLLRDDLEELLEGIR